MPCKAAPPPSTNTYQPGRRILEKIHNAQTERQPIELDIGELTYELFDFLWTAEHAYPLLIHNANRHLQLDWDAQCFIDLFGDERCIVENCKTGQQRKSTVGEFFQKFGKESPERDVERIKVALSLVCYEKWLIVPPCIRIGPLRKISKLQNHQSDSMKICFPRFLWGIWQGRMAAGMRCLMFPSVVQSLMFGKLCLALIGDWLSR